MYIIQLCPRHGAAELATLNLAMLEVMWNTYGPLTRSHADPIFMSWTINSPGARFGVAPRRTPCQRCGVAEFATVFTALPSSTVAKVGPSGAAPLARCST